jgi:hypothetical protein
MTIQIRQGYQLEIDSPGWGRVVLFAESPEGLDAEFEAYPTRLLAVRESRSAKLLAQLAGRQRQLYRAAREAVGP